MEKNEREWEGESQAKRKSLISLAKSFWDII